MSIYWVGSINYLPIWSCGELADYAVDHYISYLLSTTRDALTSFQNLILCPRISLCYSSGGAQQAHPIEPRTYDVTRQDAPAHTRPSSVVYVADLL